MLLIVVYRPTHPCPGQFLSRKIPRKRKGENLLSPLIPTGHERKRMSVEASLRVFLIKSWWRFASHATQCISHSDTGILPTGFVPIGPGGEAPIILPSYDSLCLPLTPSLRAFLCFAMQFNLFWIPFLCMRSFRVIKSKALEGIAVDSSRVKCKQVFIIKKPR